MDMWWHDYDATVAAIEDLEAQLVVLREDLRFIEMMLGEF